MDLTKYEAFLRKHLPAFVVAVILTAGALWPVAHQLYATRINLLKDNNADLKEKVAELNNQVIVLQEFKERASKRKLMVVSQRIDYGIDELGTKLFTPSQPTYK